MIPIRNNNNTIPVQERGVYLDHFLDSFRWCNLEWLHQNKSRGLTYRPTMPLLHLHKHHAHVLHTDLQPYSFTQNNEFLQEGRKRGASRRVAPTYRINIPQALQLRPTVALVRLHQHLNNVRGCTFMPPLWLCYDSIST
jgi:hypothetical protein